ncbi:hypothetical protein LCGC14_2291200, partial [marine sediment metagenome]
TIYSDFGNFSVSLVAVKSFFTSSVFGEITDENF